MTKTLDDDTVASYPGKVRLSYTKLKRLHPELYSRLAWIFFDWRNGKLVNRRSFWLTHIEEHLLFGDSRAAVVIGTSPLLVAAYTDELDCVAVLSFDDSFASEYNLEPGSRLVTVNLYEYMNGSYETDLKPGPGARGYYRNFTPLIGDFLTDDIGRLNERKAEISEDEWRRTEMLGQSYLSENHARPRDGRPLWSSLPYEQFQAQSSEPATVDVKESRITLLEIPKRILFVIIFLLLTLWGVREIRIHPRVAWFGTALFGTMCVISMVSLMRLPRDLKNRVGVREVLSFKRASTWIITIAVSFFLGFAGELMVDVMAGPWPNFVIWLSSFVTTALFYPFRGEMKKDFPNFTFWSIYAVLCGFISVVVAQLKWWLEV